MEENLEWARAGSGTLDARAGGGGGALRRDPDHQPWRHTAGLGRLRLRGTADPGGGATSGSWLVLDSGVGCGLWDRRGGSGSRISFNPSLFNAGDLGGRALGINWVWAQWTLGYHAVWSISIPILLAELVFPARRSEPWLGRAGLITTGVFYVLGVLAFTPTSATRRKTSLATCAEA